MPPFISLGSDHTANPVSDAAAALVPTTSREFMVPCAACRDLDYNKLSGPLPATWSAMTALMHLYAPSPEHES
jgi:hypothetical protein